VCTTLSDRSVASTVVTKTAKPHLIHFYIPILVASIGCAHGQSEWVV